MNRDAVESLLAHFKPLTFVPGSSRVLRQLVLQLAMQGSLTTTAATDEPVALRLATIRENHPRPRKKRQQHAITAARPLYSLPPTWQWARFDDVATIASNLVAPQAFPHEPHIAPNHIEKATGRLLDHATVSRDGVRSNKHRFFAGQLLYSKIRPNLAKSAVVDFGGLCSADMYPVDVHIDTAYLHLYTLSAPFLASVTSDDNRLAMPKVNQNQLNAVPVPVPPMQEQQRIVTEVRRIWSVCDELDARQEKKRQARARLDAACLDRLLTARSRDEFAEHWQRFHDNFDVLHESPAHLETLRDAIHQLAVTGKLTTKPAPRQSALDLLARIHDTRQRHLAAGNVRSSKATPPMSSKDVLFDAPAHWGWQRFGLLADIASGVTKGRKLGGRKTSSLPYLRVANVQRGFLDLTVIKELVLPEDELQKYALEAGDVLLTEGGDWDKLGRSAIWTGEIAPCVHQNHVFRARLFDSGLQARWITLLTNSPVGRSYFAGAAKQTTNLASINMTQLRALPVPIPPPEEQDRILAELDRLIGLCDQLQRSLAARESIAASLLSALVERVAADALPRSPSRA